MTFWAASASSSSNTSSHQFDWSIQYNGTGGGFDNMILASPGFDIGVYASPTDETKAHRWIRGDQGLPG
ncbi:hypothetical protein MJ575_23015 [Klebsiella pneumoniae]|nr:hypothetical protein MJ575_23015 [Klebsiella pneumoniae]